MSVKLVRDALEAQLVALTHGAIPIAWENKQYKPTVGTPYLKVDLLPGQTQNPTFGAVHKREVGVFRIMAMFPVGNGSAAAAAWAETLREGFKRGSSFTSGGVTVTIYRTPSVAPSLQSADWFAVPVQVAYQADVLS